jgi:Holliday junction DNA helicase RuvA
MISFLRGTLASKNPTSLVVDVGGVGYAVHIPLSSYQRIGPVGSEITLLTYLHVREDILQLYGFASDEERRLFQLLIAISGIGPRMAQTILSGIPVADFKQAITANDVDLLVTIPGIGRKTAQRLIVELKGKFGDGEEDAVSPVVTGRADRTLMEEAVLALVSLGYKRAQAREIMQKIIESEQGPLPVEEMIKKALRVM